MKGKLIFSVFVWMLLMGSVAVSAINVNTTFVSKNGKNSYCGKEIKAGSSEDNSYQLDFVTFNSNEIDNSKVSLENNLLSRNDVLLNESKDINVVSEDKEYMAYNKKEYNYNSDEYVRYDGSLKKTPVTSKQLGDGTTSPPWDECDSGVGYATYTGFYHDDWDGVNCNIGKGDIGVCAAVGIAQFDLTQVYCWMKGNYVCDSTGDHYVEFLVDWDAVIDIIDIPSVWLTGADKLEFTSNAYFQIAGQTMEDRLIYFGDSWPTWGQYNVPGPYDDDGPFKIGYEQFVDLVAGYSYEFFVQFNVFVDAAAFGFTGVEGSLDLDCWFLEADMRPKSTPPSLVDLVSAEAFIIDDEIGYTIWTDPWYFSPGDTVELHATIWNAGIDDANGFKVAIGLDNSYGLSETVNCPAGNWPDNALHFTASVVWPNDLNVHYVWCEGDYNNDIAEIYEDNNVGIHPHSAIGPPDLGISDITLLQCQASEDWSPGNPDSIDWQNADAFEVGDRVTPLAMITNEGEGPAFDFDIELFYDDNAEPFAAVYGVALNTNDFAIAFISDQDGKAGLNWPDADCHDFRWEIHEHDYGQSDSEEETYCPEIPDEPEIEMNPTSHDYGTVIVGEYEDKTFIIENIGNARATGSVSISGNSDFIIINGVNSFDLKPGETQNVKVRFQPSSQGSKTATLNSNGYSPCNDDSSSITGTGRGINCLSLSPPSHDFGDVDIGESSGNFVFNLQTNIDSTVTGSVYIEGEDSSQFTLIEGGGNFSLETGASILIKVSFNPTSEGDMTAKLVADPEQSSCNKETATLTGEGSTIDDLDLDPNNENFGSIYVDECSDNSSFTLKNNGIENISGNIFISGSDPNHFKIKKGGGSFTITGGSTKTIEVKFCPKSKGSKSASLKVDADYPYEDVSSSLSGNGEFQDILSLHPTNHNFPDTKEAECSEYFSFVLKNNDDQITAKVNIYEESNDFKISEGGVVDIPPDSTHILEVKFCPQSEGNKEASLIIDGINCKEKSATLTGKGLSKAKKINWIQSFFYRILFKFPFLQKLLSDH